jgi:hypothetical protein
MKTNTWRALGLAAIIGASVFTTATFAANPMVGGAAMLPTKNIIEKRGGSVCLNRLLGEAKWISALVMPLPGLATAR